MVLAEGMAAAWGAHLVAILGNETSAGVIYVVENLRPVPSLVGDLLYLHVAMFSGIRQIHCGILWVQRGRRAGARPGAGDGSSLSRGCWLRQ